MYDKDKFLSVSGLNKNYNGRAILDNLSFDIKEGEFVSILGPSGCGKTTILNLLIGIINADSGSIIKKGEDITYIDSCKRKMGIVFQNYALFPNMTVLKNVEYALSIKKETKKTARTVALNLLNKMGLSDHVNKKPSKLSGGQQQRVAIARTLALNPDIILFDEPMSALDVNTRLMLREELKNLQKEYNITMLYITHDQEEAFSMSDRIMVMSEGHIEQFDTPRNIVDSPTNEYVKDFVVEQIRKKVAALAPFVKE